MTNSKLIAENKVLRKALEMAIVKHFTAKDVPKCSEVCPNLPCADNNCNVRMSEYLGGMIMDEFEKWVESISKTASYSDQRELMRVVLNHYRAFKAKQKPTAPASLVEELRRAGEQERAKIINPVVSPEPWRDDEKVTYGEIRGIYKLEKRISEILSRHESVIKQSLTTDKDNLTVRKEVVLAEGTDVVNGPIEWWKIKGQTGELIWRPKCSIKN